MFNIKKKNDHNDISLYLPDNLTVATSEFFRKKHGNRLPEHLYQIMEAASRKEYDDEDIQVIKELALKEKMEFDNKLMREYAERAAEDYKNEVIENNIMIE